MKKSERPALLLVVLGLAGIAAALMQTLIIPIQGALPELLGTSASNASWMITATLLSGAVTMPIAGRLADLRGKKPVLIACSGLMLVGSVLCALSADLGPMLLGRVLQGCAMGYIPVAISLAREVMPQRLVNTATAIISATMGVGNALGLPVGAWIAQHADWQLLFWVSAGLAALMITLTIFVVPAVPPLARGTFDRLGAIGLSVGLASVLVAVTKGNDWGWGAPATLTMIIGGSVALAAWGVYELRVEQPLVELRTSARLPVLFTNLAAVMAGIGMMGISIVLPQLLRLPADVPHGLGQSIIEVGLWMAPAGLTMLLFSPVCSAMLTRFGARITLAAGTFVIASAYGVAMITAEAPWTLMLIACLAMAGVGIAYAALPTLILDHTPAADAAAGVALNALMRSVGATLAGAIMAIALTSSTVEVPSTGALLPTSEAFFACFVIGASAALLAAVLALLIPRRGGSRRSATRVDPEG